MPNLLQKASIVLTPTAYDDGKVLCAKPSEPPYGDFDFSRNSAATRVNAQGLVEDVQILSSNLVQNGDFSEQGVEEVSNGSFSQQGSELITNGSFDTDSDWTLSNGSNISGGFLLMPDGGTALQTTSATNTNVKFVIDGVGDVSYRLNTGVGYSTISLPQTIYTTTGASGSRVQLINSSGSDAIIDNVSVVEVGQDWTIEDVWTIGDGVANGNGANGSSEELTQTKSLTLGKSYKVVYEILNYVSGSVQFQFAGGATLSGDTRSADGTYTQYVVATANHTLLKFKSNNPFYGSITNISVKEVGQNWDFNSDYWSIVEGSANFLDVATSGLIQNISFVAGKTYNISFQINSGSASIGFYSSNAATNYIPYAVYEVGTHSVSFNYTTGANLSILGNKFGGTAFSITNISIIEITDDTNLPRINYEGFSYDGSGNIIPDSGCGSWLWEPQSTNLLPYSEDFSQWTPIGAPTITSNYGISPDGANNSTRVQGSSASMLYYQPTTTSGFARSIYIKATSGSGNVQALSYSGNTNNVFSINENWQRIEINSLTDSTGDNNFYAVDFRGASTNIYDIEIWGAQAEDNISYATSYIPTSGTSVTRNQDVCNNGGSVSTINSTEGVLYAEIAALANDGTNRAISISDGSTANVVRFYYSTTNNRIVGNVKSGGTTYLNFNNVLSSATDFLKVAISYKLNEFKMYVNGILVFTDTSGNTPINLNELAFDNGAGNDNFYGKTKCVAVWKEALSDEELTLLTAPAPVAPTFTLDFDEIANQFTFLRASVGSIVNEQGLIETDIQNNIPRIDYSTGTEAFLLEPQSTNLIPYSEDFSQASWAKGGVSAVSGFSSPDGGTGAFELIESTNTGVHFLANGVGVSSGSTNYNSIYVKPNGVSWVRLYDGANNEGVYFDLQNKVIGNKSAAVLDYSITELSDGWLRIGFSSVATSTSVVFRLYLASANGVISYTGDGVSGLYIWGAQVEQLPYATSYIPTSGTTVTRVGETCANATPEINSEEGALYFEGRTLANGAGVRSISLSDGTTQQRILIRYSSAENQLSLYCIEGGNLSAIVGTNSYNLLEFNKIAISYKQNNFKFFVNGTKIGEDNSGSTPTLLNKLSFNGGSGENFYGNTKDVQVFTEALSDYQLAQLTTI